MHTDGSALRDSIEQHAEFLREDARAIGIVGSGLAVVRDARGRITQEVEFHNLVTRVGDQYYGDRAAGIGSIAAITGMQLGTGTTAPAKTSTGATIITLVASSLVALTGGFPASSLATNSRRIQYQVLWAAGVATATGIAEVVLTNQSVGTQTAVPEANSISRALLSPVVNKGASDTLTITWNHDLLGA
jgi:hypothetical protein